MKIVGILFVVLSSLSVGLRYAHMVQQRCTTIGQIILALRLLKSELSVHGTPLPEAFGLLAAATSGSTAAYFSSAAKEMNHSRWISPQESLRTAEIHLKEFGPKDPSIRILRDVSSGIGKLDMDSQLNALDNAISRFEILRHSAEQDRSVRCRTYRTLGLCAGIALAILLI